MDFALDSKDLEPVTFDDEKKFEQVIRPQLLSEYVGQDAVASGLSLAILAARQRKEALDHLLLAGPPGLGKTTLAQIVSRELGVGFHSVAAPNIDRKGDLAALLSVLKENDVLFIDEIHRLPSAIEEILYSAMEDFKLEIIIGQGPAARTMRIDLPKFTLVGATTRTGLLTHPMRDRFGLQFRLDFYNDSDLMRILSRSAKILGIDLENESAQIVSRASRGTPRIANRLLRRVRDFCQVKRNVNRVIPQDAIAALEALQIDPNGMDPMDRKYLGILVKNFRGGPVGVENLATALSEESATLEDVIEPYLIRSGWIERTPRGRVALPKAVKRFQEDVPSS